MIRLRDSSLDVLVESNSAFTDFTDDMWTYQRDSVTVTIEATDKLWIGFEKPINSFYPYMSTASTPVNAISVKYFDGTDFQDVRGLYDGTKGFTRNGFVSWDVNQNQADSDRVSTSSDQVVTTINGLERFWYEISFSVDTSQIVLQGLNLIFADTEDLKLEFPEIQSVINQSIAAGNEIVIYEAVRLDIVKALRTQPDFTLTTDTSRDFRLEPINQWDIFNIEELNAAARNLSISKIYGLMSTEPGDTWARKSEMYKNRYETYFETALLNVDILGDGIESIANSNIKVGHVTLIRN